jgi:hypothetical protein
VADVSAARVQATRGLLEERCCASGSFNMIACVMRFQDRKKFERVRLERQERFDEGASRCV